MTIRHIRVAWIAGMVTLVAGGVLPEEERIIVQLAAILVLIVAWGSAIRWAAHSGEMGWAILLAILPCIMMWVYIFRRQPTVMIIGVAQPYQQPYPPQYLPPHGVRNVLPYVDPFADSHEVPSDPLVIRQAQQVIEDAERQDPDW